MGRQWSEPVSFRAVSDEDGVLTFGNRVNSLKTLGVSEPSRCRWKALEWLSRASKAPFPEARGTWLAMSFPLQQSEAFALSTRRSWCHIQSGKKEVEVGL